jgi:outer membrane immunogenic protein
MNRTALAIIAIALIATPASAADLALKAPPYAEPPPLWTACYISAGAGYGLWNQDHFTSTPAAPNTVTTTDGGRGWLGRFGGGCDYQTPLFGYRIVIGAFGDYDVMGLGGSNSPSLVNIATGSPVTFNSTETGAWYAGARIGYLVTPLFLTYFDGGYTQTRFSNSAEFTTAFGGLTGAAFPNYSPSGWFIGGGYEYALNFNWLPINGLFWKTEYRFSEYNNANLGQFIIATGVPTGNVEHITPYVQTVTTSLVWRFNFLSGR